MSKGLTGDGSAKDAVCIAPAAWSRAEADDDELTS
jgi:hypothetical protein